MYTLYAIPDWASLAVHMVLEELAVPYQIAAVDYDAGGLDTPEFRRVNPFGKLPAMDTPDGPMFETAAILLWLADRHGRLAPIPQSPDRATFLSWLMFVANTFHPNAIQQFYPHRPAGEAHADAASAIAYENLKAQMAQIETVAATRPVWLSPDQPSILGPYLCMLIRWLQFLPANPAHRVNLGDFPALMALAKATETHPAFARAAADEGLTGTYFSSPES